MFHHFFLINKSKYGRVVLTHRERGRGKDIRGLRPTINTTPSSHSALIIQEQQAALHKLAGGVWLSSDQIEKYFKYELQILMASMYYYETRAFVR
jgi:hypothetical protein